MHHLPQLIYFQCAAVIIVKGLEHLAELDLLPLEQLVEGVEQVTSAVAITLNNLVGGRGQEQRAMGGAE